MYFNVLSAQLVGKNGSLCSNVPTFLTSYDIVSNGTSENDKHVNPSQYLGLFHITNIDIFSIKKTPIYWYIHMLQF